MSSISVREIMNPFHLALRGGEIEYMMVESGMNVDSMLVRYTEVLGDKGRKFEEETISFIEEDELTYEERIRQTYYQLLDHEKKEVVKTAKAKKILDGGYRLGSILSKIKDFSSLFVLMFADGPGTVSIHLDTAVGSTPHGFTGYGELIEHLSEEYDYRGVEDYEAGVKRFMRQLFDDRLPVELLNMPSSFAKIAVANDVPYFEYSPKMEDVIVVREDLIECGLLFNDDRLSYEKVI